MLRILTIIGTRPEVIKLAPVIRALQKYPGMDSRVCITSQQRQFVYQMLLQFEIIPDYDLDIMQPGQDLYDITARTLLGLREVLRSSRPNMVIVQGDTTTCMVGALAATYEGVEVCHVEAGLRTGDARSPFPEEINRILVSKLAKLHFANTADARRNLLKENISPENIWITGSTVIDALRETSVKNESMDGAYWQIFYGNDLHANLVDPNRKTILVTGHRRENFTGGLRNVCIALQRLAHRYPSWDFVYPIHLNPVVQATVREVLSGIANVYLIEPPGYREFIWLMNCADLIITDSGGIQEEAPYLGIPVLVSRDTTERTEAIDAGVAKLVGVETDGIIRAVSELMHDEGSYHEMARRISPYGDGNAAPRIASVIHDYLVAEHPVEEVKSQVDSFINRLADALTSKNGSEVSNRMEDQADA